MKATGIVRRLDDLGRLVIPKEIRKKYRLKEGDSIEFYTDSDRIIIQKHDHLSAHAEEIEIMCERCMLCIRIRFSLFRIVCWNKKEFS